MKKDIYVPIIGIVLAELYMFFGDVFYGLIIHAINLLFIVLIITFSDIRLEEKNILQSLTLIILLVIINLSIPQFFTTDILQYPVIYGIMFIPIYYTIRNQYISSEEMGMSFKKLYVYLPISIFIGLIIAIVEYKILSPASLIDNINMSNVILIMIVMFIFVGLVEEVIFRSIVQTRIEKIFGPNFGILLTGGLFGMMHGSYGAVTEIIFATIIGVVLSYMFRITRSLPLVVSTHGIANIMSFGILANITFMM